MQRLEPIRKIDSIRYIKQPTGYLCGQSVIAMLADVPVNEVIAVMHNDRGCSVVMMRGALDYYGLKHARSRTRATQDTLLPELCILSLQLPGYGHWSLYYKGVYYDPEFGMRDELPPRARLDYLWKITP